MAIADECYPYILPQIPLPYRLQLQDLLSLPSWMVLQPAMFRDAVATLYTDGLSKCFF